MVILCEMLHRSQQYDCEISKEQLSYISSHFILQNTQQDFSWTVTIVWYPKISWVISLHIFYCRILDRVSHGQLQLWAIQKSAELYRFIFFIAEYSTGFLMDSYNCVISKDQLSYISSHFFSEYSTGFVMDSYNCEISKDQLSYISLHIFFQNTRQGFSWTVTIVRYPKSSWVISLHIFYCRILYRVSHGQLQ